MKLTTVKALTLEVAFKRANSDNDATIDAKELKTPAGRALLRLLLK
jgi:hypothetical protein